MRAPLTQRVPLAGLVAACVVLALMSFLGRRAWIQTFFGDGEGSSGLVTLARANTDSAPLRVVLIDGLGQAHADTLPELAKLCDRGERLVVDSGFPTVSLPVQHVLWTGRPQWRSGVLYRIARLPEAPPDALPASVEGSHAVAESHVDIVHSFGFSTAEPSDEEMVDEAWRSAGFDHAAQSAIASDAPLVFVHALRVDEAGHRSGSASSEYARAAAEIDAMLPGWVAQAPAANWLITADHGHRPQGGHGGNEAEIRKVRACRFGPDVEPADQIEELGLPQLAMDLRTRVGRVATTPDSAAWPSPSVGRVGGALALLAGFVLLAWRWGKGWAFVWPLLCAAGFVAAQGWPSLSIPAVYPPLGAVAAGWGIGGILLLAALALRTREPLDAWLLRAFAPALGLLGAAHVMAGSVGTLISGVPPLAPGWTAWASLGSIWMAAGAGSAALLLPVCWRLRRAPIAGGTSLDAHEAGSLDPLGREP